LKNMKLFAKLANFYLMSTATHIKVMDFT